MGSDRFGLALAGIASEDQRIDVLKTLADEGHADRIVLSHDAVLYSGWTDRQAAVPSTLQTWVPTRISDVVVLRMRAVGMTSHQVAAMLEVVPAAMFVGLAP